MRPLASLSWLPSVLLLLSAAGCSQLFKEPDGFRSPGQDSGTRHEDPDEDESDPPDDSADTQETGPDDTQDTEEPPPEPWSFVVFGDNQFATTSCTSGVDERLAVPQVVLELAPNALFHTGDLMDHGYDSDAYDQLRSCYADMLAAVPFFPTSGNHDMGSGGIGNYELFLEDQLFNVNPLTWSGDYTAEVAVAYEDDPNSYSEDFDEPTAGDEPPSGVSFETFYAARIKNLYLLSFEQGTKWWTNTPRPWVESHLAAARADPSVDHIVVIMHHPMYSTTMAEDSDGESIGGVREDYEVLFQAYDVSVVFAGHAHVYEHFWVSDSGASTRAEDPPSSFPYNGDSVHYIVTGGGGGPLPGCDPMASPIEESSASFLQNRGCGYHVTQVEVEGERLTVRVIGVDGDDESWSTELWDEFSMEPT